MKDIKSKISIYDNQHHIAGICERYGVKRLGIFGSATTGELKETSDLDVSVIFDRNGFDGSFERYMGLKEELEELFCREVDLVTVDRIRNPVFAREVEETQEVIYAA